jgi:hypothetical protein
VVFDIDGTRQAARQRALPATADLPPVYRRLQEVCAPGYVGRKRGEVVRTRSTVLLALFEDVAMDEVRLYTVPGSKGACIATSFRSERNATPYLLPRSNDVVSGIVQVPGGKSRLIYSFVATVTLADDGEVGSQRGTLLSVSNCPFPNRACGFPRTRLSSDLFRVVCHSFPACSLLWHR